MTSGSATPAATAAWAARWAALSSKDSYRSLRWAEGGLQISSLGLGTYLGEPDESTDAGYEAAIAAALAGGVNLIDTAINYRHQRSERAIGRALERAFASPGTPREALVICTKAGYFPFDNALPTDPRQYVLETYLRPGLVHPGQIAGGCHTMAPVFLADQLGRSRRNLGLETVDVFYLHNPETQAAELSREEFYRRLRAAFEFGEKAVANGLIRAYGVATWSGFRVPPDQPGYLELNRMVAIAREIAGEQHHFRFLQLPYNLRMPEATVLMNQPVEKPPYVSLLGAAARLGVHVIASAALAGGQLRELGPEAQEHLRAFLPGAKTPVELALQFARAGMAAALTGMSRPEHVAANLRVLRQPAPTAVQISRLLRQ